MLSYAYKELENGIIFTRTKPMLIPSHLIFDFFFFFHTGISGIFMQILILPLLLLGMYTLQLMQLHCFLLGFLVFLFY
jgi:hypothetical protein